jgi:hypothetical protein
MPKQEYWKNAAAQSPSSNLIHKTVDLFVKAVRYPSSFFSFFSYD